MALRPRRVDAQLDAYVSGSAEWATGGDGDGGYEDACVAETEYLCMVVRYTA